MHKAGELREGILVITPVISPADDRLNGTFRVICILIA